MNKYKSKVIQLEDRQNSETKLTYKNGLDESSGTEGQLAKKYELIETSSSETKSIKIVQNNSELTFEVPDGYKATVAFEIDSNSTSLDSFDTIDKKKNNSTIEKNGNYSSGTAYDIINKEMFTRSDKNNNCEEVIAMTMYNIFNKQIKFLMVALAFIIFSLVGLIVFIKTNVYIIHPFIYIVTLLMGTGWGLTALSSIKHSKV